MNITNFDHFNISILFRNVQSEKIGFYLRNIFLSLFKSKRFKERAIFNNIEVLKTYNEFLKDDSVHSLGIFQIFITELWFRLFIDNNPSKFSGIKLDEFIFETN